MAAPTPETLADDLTALIDTLTQVPAILVGTSGGAVTILELARSHPGLVAHAVLHEPPVIALLNDEALENRAHQTGPDQIPPTNTVMPDLSAAELEKNRYFLGQMGWP